MELTWLYFLAACLLVLWLSTKAEKQERIDAVAVAIILFAGWASTNIPALCCHIDDTRHVRTAMLVYVIQAAVVGAVWASHPAAWKMGVLFAIGDQALLVVFHTPAPWSGEAMWPARRHDYVTALNILLGVKLACNAWPGGRDVGLRLRRRWFPVRRHHHRALSPARRANPPA